MTLSQREQARLQVLNSLLAEHMTMEQASTLMGVSTRHTRRILAAYRKEGAAALAHGHRGRRAPNAISEATKTAVLHLARTRYSGTNHTHMSELLSEREGIDITRSTLRRLLVNAGENSPRRRRPPKHRVRRQRMPREGMLIQVDGSYHRWLGKDGPQFTLLLAIDDASGIVVNALFCELENTHSYFSLLDGLIRRCGIPIALYSDRHAVFKYTPPSEAAGAPTQFSRAMDELGDTADIRSITSGQGSCGTRRGNVPGQARHRAPACGRDHHRRCEPRAGGLPSTLQRPLQGACAGVGSRLSRRGRRRCAWRRSCASSTGAESPGTTRSDTAGAHFNCCPARTGRPTPEQLWMCSKDWTIAWQCSTRDATSHHRKRHRVRVSSGASPGEPRTHPSSISPPTVWVLNGRPSWRLWMPTTMPSSPSSGCRAAFVGHYRSAVYTVVQLPFPSGR